MTKPPATPKPTTTPRPRLPTKMSAEDRLHRILAMVPWIVAHDGPTVEATCERFACSPEDLVRDIELLYLCGLHPFTPDLLIEAGIVDGRVFINYAEYLSRPLRLTPAEGLALVATANTLLATPGTDAEGPLARGLAKLAGVIGATDSDVEVDLGSADAALLAQLRASASALTQLEIQYYAYGRDETSIRRIETGSVFSNGGAWYVAAYCHQAAAERIFRVDRILSASETTAPRTASPVSIGPNELRPGDGGWTVVLRLDQTGGWVREQYPIQDWVEADDGSATVTLLVNEWPWLDRLLLRLGRTAQVVEAPAEWPGRSAPVERIRARYSKDRIRPTAGLG